MSRTEYSLSRCRRSSPIATGPRTLASLIEVPDVKRGRMPRVATGITAVRIAWA